ncbi:MAG: DinB family protein [Lewinellaceae bacterium]|nr:DinB family protein [Lewinellaceae bacterium]
MKRPKKGEFPPMHAGYLKQVPPRAAAGTLLKKTMREAQALFGKLNEAEGNYRYAPGKWSVKEMLMHIIDSERVFSYRALSFIRGDRIGLPGFNQDFWMEEVDVSNRSVQDLMKEWKFVRENTLYLLKQCSEEQSVFPGKASGFTVTPRALFFIIIGHQIHHMKIFEQLYLPGLNNASTAL